MMLKNDLKFLFFVVLQTPSLPQDEFVVLRCLKVCRGMAKPNSVAISSLESQIISVERKSTHTHTRTHTTSTIGLAQLTVHVGGASAYPLAIHALLVLALAHAPPSVEGCLPLSEGIVAAATERKGSKLARVATQVVLQAAALGLRHEVLHQRIRGQPLQNLGVGECTRVHVIICEYGGHMRWWRRFRGHFGSRHKKKGIITWGKGVLKIASDVFLWERTQVEIVYTYELGRL